MALLAFGKVVGLRLGAGELEDKGFAWPGVCVCGGAVVAVFAVWCIWLSPCNQHVLQHASANLE